MCFTHGAVVVFKLVLFEIVKLLVKLYVDYIGVIIEAWFWGLLWYINSMVHWFYSAAVMSKEIELSCDACVF